MWITTLLKLEYIIAERGALMRQRIIAGYYACIQMYPPLMMMFKSLLPFLNQRCISADQAITEHGKSGVKSFLIQIKFYNLYNFSKINRNIFIG